MWWGCRCRCPQEDEAVSADQVCDLQDGGLKKGFNSGLAARRNGVGQGGGEELTPDTQKGTLGAAWLKEEHIY